MGLVLWGLGPFGGCTVGLWVSLIKGIAKAIRARLLGSFIN